MGGSFWSNPAGPNFNNFDNFLTNRDASKPFCFWFGSKFPHRSYVWQSGVNEGKNLADAKVPGYFPDVDTIRHDLLDYAVEVEDFDDQVGVLLQNLESHNQLENTIILVTSDHGMPFPRGKGQVYNEGIHVPTAIRWGKKISGKRVVDDFVNWVDIAPTLLDLAGIPPEPEFSGSSMLGILNSAASGWIDPAKNYVWVGRERHDTRRSDSISGKQDVGYPVRGIRTSKYMFTINYTPHRWPSGDPPCYNNVDPSPTHTFLVDHMNDPQYSSYYDLSFRKRIDEELYDLKVDPYSLNNLAMDPQFQNVKDSLKTFLENTLKEQQDPRMDGNGDVFDDYPHFMNSTNCRI